MMVTIRNYKQLARKKLTMNKLHMAHTLTVAGQAYNCCLRPSRQRDRQTLDWCFTFCQGSG